ncbi:GNAT family N-acetyltransferase [Klenkia sp. LSe6-5]|uniref:GNAT family N-acetyltransferase n=1 Tax=Klenkia sesuvii TaxID=3103137 RepID=A0ABU8DX48_9ACTN
MAEPITGGVPRYVAALANHQAEGGWEVTVAAPPDSEVAHLLHPAVRVAAWQAGPAPSARLPLEVHSLRRLIAGVAPDVVHLHGAKAGLAGRWVVRGNTPTVHQPHSAPWNGRGPTMARLVRSWERFALRWTDRVLFVAAEEARSADAASVRGPAVVVDNGVDLNHHRAADTADRVAARLRLGLPGGPMVVCVGRLHRQKGQHDLLDAWPAVRRAVPAARLVLVGDGPDGPGLSARAVPGVELRGASDDVATWLRAADVVVLPSRWEGLSLTSLEAMATARPVVITDVDGSSAVGRSGGGAVVPRGDGPALAAAVTTRLLDPGRCEAEGWAGRQWVEQHHDRRAQLAAATAVDEAAALAAASGGQRIEVVAAHGVLGGSENWLLAMLDELPGRQVAATVLQAGPFADALRSRRVPTTVRPVGPSPLAVLAAVPGLARRWRRRPPAVVLGNGVKAQLLAAPAARMAGVPSVWVKHDHSYDRVLAYALGRLSTAVVGTDAAVLEPVGRPDGVVVVPPRPASRPAGRAAARNQLRDHGRTPPDDQLWLGMATRLVPYKGVEDAVRALCLDDADGWHLVVLGEDDPSTPGEGARLSQMASDLGVADRVHLLGSVPSAPTLMAAFDASAMLTRPAGRRSPGKEGFGGAAMESMVAGTPVVTVTGSPAAGRAGDEAGRVVLPADPQDLARALGQLSDPQLRGRLAAEARRRSADHPDAATCAQELDGVLRSAARSHPAAGPPGAGRLRVRLVPRSAVDDDLVQRWAELAGRAAVANPFLRPELALAALDHLPDTKDVRLLLVEDTDGRALRLLTMVQVARHWRRVPVRVVRTWLHANMFLGTPLVDRVGDPQVWRAVLTHLREQRVAPWLVLEDCDPEVLDDVEAAVVLAGGGPARRARQVDRAWTVRRPDGTVPVPLSGRRRKELRRVRRRLGEAVAGLAVADLVSLSEGNSADDRVGAAPAVDTFLDLEASGWKGRTGGALQRQQGHAEFFRAGCLAMAEAGDLQILALRGGEGRPVAMACNLRSGDGLFHFKIAHDEALAEFSPGLLLQLDQVDAFASSGARYVDSCAVEDHAMANRMHPDRRRLASLLVALDGGPGRWAVNHAHDVHRALEQLKRVKKALTTHRHR